MMNDVNFIGITSTNWNDVKGTEVAPGIYKRSIWSGEKGKRAVVFEFEAGSKFPGVDAHLTGPEQIFVISGVFNDGENDHNEGSFINNPVGSAHIPQSKVGCIVLTTFPEG